jgi:hypothetical protein
MESVVVAPAGTARRRVKSSMIAPLFLVCGVESDAGQRIWLYNVYIYMCHDAVVVPSLCGGGAMSIRQPLDALALW